MPKGQLFTSRSLGCMIAKVEGLRYNPHIKTPLTLYAEFDTDIGTPKQLKSE